MPRFGLKKLRERLCVQSGDGLWHPKVGVSRFLHNNRPQIGGGSRRQRYDRIKRACQLMNDRIMRARSSKRK